MVAMCRVHVHNQGDKAMAHNVALHSLNKGVRAGDRAHDGPCEWVRRRHLIQSAEAQNCVADGGVKLVMQPNLAPSLPRAFPTMLLFLIDNLLPCKKEMHALVPHILLTSGE